MGGFKKFEEKLPRKKRFYNSLTGKKIIIKKMKMFLMFGIYLK